MILNSTTGPGKTLNLLKAGFALLLAIYGVICMLAEQGTFLDRVDLIAHEAGHLLFGYFGEFMMVIGGTLGQLLVPAGIVFYFVVRQEFYSSSVVLFWLGQNMFNISVYIKDAAAMDLPLVSIGGGDAIHDWNWLLLKFNVLAWDRQIGNFVFGLGTLIIAVSVLLGFYFSYSDAEES